MNRCEPVRTFKPRWAWWLAAIGLSLGAAVGSLLPLATAQVATTTPARPVDSPYARWVDSLKSTLEKQMTALALQRNSTGASHEIIDVQLDLCVIQHWLLEKADAAGDARADLLLRQMQLAAATNGFNDWLAASRTTTPNDLQELSMKRLHAATYALPPTATTLQADALCDAAGVLILEFIIPGAGRVVPTMRPSPHPSTGARADRVDTKPKPTLSQLAMIARQTPAPDDLHRQLAALAYAADVEAASAGGPSAAPPSAAGPQIYSALWESVDITRGLQALPIKDDARDAILGDLTNALVLFVDVRTRSTGQARLDALTDCQKAINRVAALPMPKTESDAIAPALAWAVSNPRASQELLDAVEKFAKTTARQQARHRYPLGDPILNQAMDSLADSFVGLHAAFVSSATRIDSPAFFMTSAREMGNLNEQLEQAVGAEESIDRLPATLDDLSPIKVKPVGGLEKQAMAAVVAAASPVWSGARNQSRRFLADLDRLADQYHAIRTHHPANLPAEILRDYAADSTARLETRWRLIVNDLCNSAAAKATLDPNKLSELDWVVAIQGGLDEAVGVEAAAARTRKLAGWADWHVSHEQIEDLIDPYRAATRAAVVGFASNDMKPLDRWQSLRRSDAPLFAFLTESATYTDACADLPTDLRGLAAQLMTPQARQPFAPQRRASVDLAAWSFNRSAGDAGSAQKTLDDLLEAMRGIQWSSNP